MILQSLYYFLPVFVSNMVPPLVARIPVLSTPIDLGYKYKNKRIFGDHKTFRGLVFGTLIGTLIFLVQKYLYNFEFFNNLSIIDYSTMPLTLGFLLAFGALVGDAIESFFKRRKDIPPGKVWVPFDQLDYIIGSILFSSLFFTPGLKLIIWVVILSSLLHPLTHYIGYVLGINRDKF